MCGGQYLDTVGDGKPHTVGELECIHAGKTGALLRAACLMGVAAGCAHGKPDDAAMRAARDYAEHLGMAFQIRDDILDATATTAELGKPAGSDAANGKMTFVTLLGAEACERLVLEHTEQAKKSLSAFPGETGFLCWLADLLAGRSH